MIINYGTAENHSIDLDQYIKPGLRMAIIGSSGSGKSNFLRVLCEQLSAAGVSCVLFDPEGEYYTLAERLPTIIVGGDHAHIRFGVGGDGLWENLAHLLSERPGTVLVLDVFGLSRLLRQSAFASMTKALFDARPLGARPIFTLIEEAEMFAPQQEKGDKEPAIELARRGRKRGLYSVWLPHRTQDFAKAVLSQCNRVFVGRLDDIRDMKAVASKLPANIEFDEMENLPSGAFMDGAQKLLVSTRMALTTDVGASPGVVVEVPAPSTDLATAIAAVANADHIDGHEDDNVVDVMDRADRPRSHTPTIPESQHNADRERLALLQNEVSEVHKLANTVKAQYDRLTIDYQRLEQRNLDLTKQLDERRDEHELVEHLRNVLFKDLALFSAASLSIAPPVQATQPLTALKEKWQSDAVERMIAKIRALPEACRQVMSLLVVLGGRANRKDLAKQVSPDQAFVGQGVSRWHQVHLTPLIKAGLISYQQNSGDAFNRLPEMLSKELEVYQPSPELLMGLEQRVYGALAGQAA